MNHMTVPTTSKRLEGWRYALAPFVTSPESHVGTGQVVSYTSEYVVVKDRYPKARAHYLILPRQQHLQTYLDLQDNLPFYRTLFEQAAQGLIQTLVQHDPRLGELGFQIGFHAFPSMLPLHLHVVSRDFLGTHLKKAHHWNSFTTPFFVPLDTFPDRNKLAAYLHVPLRCPWCTIPFKNMPQLRAHLATREHQENVKREQGLEYLTRSISLSTQSKDV